MEFVVTLIADPQKQRLSQAFVDSMAAAGLAVKTTEWLKPDVACDLTIKHDKRETLDARIQALIAGKPYDAIVQLPTSRRKKLLVADMESTIITCECLDELAEFVGLKDKIAAITAHAMNGDLDFETALRERVLLLKGLPESTLLEVYDKKAKLMPGAKELVAAMKKEGAYCMLVSGGFDFYTSRIAKLLGFDEHRSNTLEIENGKLTGHVVAPILGKEAKLQALKDTCQQRHILSHETLAVGDGANDLPMLLAAGLGVAYHAKPTVRAQAKARVEHTDLTSLLYAQGIRG